MPEVQNKKSPKDLNDQRPFLGLRSYEEKNRSQFGGRDKEVKELFGLDENSVLTVIFGKSGIGKTSLIKAGLIPELQQNFYFPIYIRIDYSSMRTPLEQVKKMVYDKMKGRDPAVSEIGDTTLWEYFHNVDLLDDLFTPVLILDQFEEIFTLGEGKKNVPELLVELADLSENRIPLKVQEEYQRLNRTVPTHYAEQPYRVILSLREDYLARLEELKKYIPSIMNSRFRVVQMTVGQALDAAIKPGKGLIDKKVAQAIIKKLPGVSQEDFDQLHQKSDGRQGLKVEPFLLSLICDRINEKRIEKGLEKITVDLVSTFNVTDVIHSFYNETILPYGENVERAIEDCLLTEGGFRKLQALEEFQRMYDISDEVVDELVDARILRKEIRDGVDYVELIHDVLAPVIKRKRDKRARRKLEEKRRKAILLAKKKQRARLIRITSFIGIGVAIVLAMTSGLAYWNYYQKRDIEQQNKKMALARDLITTSKIVGSVDMDRNKSALIARLAYLIYNKNKNLGAGEDMYDADFYNAMYEALKNDGFFFFINKFETGVQSLIHANGDELYIGLEDGSLRMMRQDSDVDSILHRFNSGSITSMDSYKQENRNLLAIAGTFDSILILDFSLGRITDSIAIPDSEQGERSVTFTANGGLILRQDSSIIRWDSTLSKVSKLNFSKEGTSSAVQFLPAADSLVVGNNRGEVFMVSIDGHDDERETTDHLAHTSVVTDIAVSPDGKWVATSSNDNTIVIWDRHTWRPLRLTPEALNTSHSFVNSVSFSPEGDYVFAGYEDGTILRWPISMDILSRLICEKVDQKLSNNEWEKYTKGIIDKEDIYDCQ